MNIWLAVTAEELQAEISNLALRERGASVWRYYWGWRLSGFPNIYVPL